jgi:hypothetical protein
MTYFLMGFVIGCMLLKIKCKLETGSPISGKHGRDMEEWLSPGIHNYGDVFRKVSGFGVRDSQRRIWFRDFRDFVFRTPNPESRTPLAFVTAFVKYST